MYGSIANPGTSSLLHCFLFLRVELLPSLEKTSCASSLRLQLVGRVVVLYKEVAWVRALLLGRTCGAWVSVCDVRLVRRVVAYRGTRGRCVHLTGPLPSSVLNATKHTKLTGRD